MAYEDILKKYGNAIFQTGKYIVENPKQLISFSPKLDIILGGGIPGGSFVVLTGQPKSGKTISALHFAGKAQKHGRKVHYLNIEGRLKSRDLAGIKTLNVDEVNIVGSVKGKILTGEEYLTIARYLVDNDPGSVIILDSVCQLTTESEFNKTTTDGSGRSGQGKILAEFCRQISNTLPVNDNIVIAITHLHANTSGFGGSPWSEGGGNKIKYAVDVKLQAKFFKDWKVGSEDSDPIGQTVNWETHSTATIAPGKRIDSNLRYGTGIDEVWEWIDIGISLGIVNKSGAWYTFEGTKVQGQAKLWHAFNEDESLVELLKTKIKELVG